MNIMVRPDVGEPRGALYLTTDSPLSHYGQPVLRATGCLCPDMGPADHLCAHIDDPAVVRLFGPRTAAEEVCQRGDALPEAEYVVAQAFLAQWPDGPQLPPFPIPAIAVEGHFHMHDGRVTFWSGVLTYATLAEVYGLPVVSIEETHRTYGTIQPGIVGPQECLPLTLCGPLTDRERVLLTAAMEQGYMLDPHSAFR